ncbi:uncharacterized protein LOC6561185 isoform X1 [Drosophila grimshawi]|uniref:uncharacterized protein LOC6561185 isoform X1 n=1 Tax=Drosophila grimshawi TaxID=7222 RepID=UPI001C936914|nr:uncharacterized protein LOC6561185 isoform X1 [Drosophila grimshawi]
MSKNECEAAEREVRLEGLAKFNRHLQSNEVLTLHYLGLPYMVLCRSPQLRLKLPLSTHNYQNGGTTARGIALQLIVTCPVNYPLQLPRIDLAEQRNVSVRLETKLRAQIARALDQHMGLQMIVPVVTLVQILLNNEVRLQH